MRRSPVLSGCVAVVVVLSLSLIDAQWMRLNRSTDQRKTTNVTIMERVQPLVNSVGRHRNSVEDEQR